MKLAIVGGGGFRVPQIVEALSKRPQEDLDVTEITLFDASSQRVSVIANVLEQMPLSRKPAISVAESLAVAVSGADFVFSAIRVGGTEARVMDELVPLKHGILGQETVGPGGYAYALRTIPAALDLARTVKENAPNAWVVNFTNPAGIITQAMRTVMGPRVIGICDTPIGLVRRAARALGRPEASLHYDYVGLNHLGWLRAVNHDGTDLLPALLSDDAMLDQIEEARLIGKDWVRQLGMIPNEYLFYYYRNREAVAQITAEMETRGQFLSRQQHEFYEAAQSDPNAASSLWDAAHREREETYMAEAREVAQDGSRKEEDLDGGYQEVALDLMTALSGGPETRMILGVSNTEGGQEPLIPSLPADSAIEVACRVTSKGAQPMPISPLGGAQLGLVTRVKACEDLVIAAALEHDFGKAWQAIASHPLVDSVEIAREITQEYYDTIPEVRRTLSPSPRPSTSFL